MTLEDAGLGRSVRMELGNCFFAFECGQETTVATFFAQERKDVADAFTQHRLAAETRDALHRAVPRDDAAVAIKREDAVNARVEQTLQESWRFVRQAENSIVNRDKCYLPVSNIKPVASRTRMFEPNNTGVAKVEDSATS